MPMLASISSVQPVDHERLAQRAQQLARRRSVASSGRRRRRGSRTPNSSPPRRATVSLLAQRASSRRATSCEQRSPWWWPSVSLISLKWSRSISITAAMSPERRAGARSPGRCGRGTARGSAGRSARRAAPGAPWRSPGGRRGGRRAAAGTAATIAGSEKSAASTTIGREAEHQAGGRGLEEAGRARGSAEHARGAGPSRSRSRRAPTLTTKNDDAGEQDAGQVARREVAARCTRGRSGGQRQHDAGARPAVIAYWPRLNAILCSGLPRSAVGDQVGASQGREGAASGPATSIIATAKVVEVVTSPSAPAREHLQRDELAEEGEEEEHHRLRRGEELRDPPRRRHHPDRASSPPTPNDGGRRRGREVRVVWRERSWLRAANRPGRRDPGTRAITTCGRCEPVMRTSPTSCPAPRPSRNTASDAGDEREAIQACLRS